MERWREPWTEQDPRTNNWFLRWRERGEDGKLHKRSLKCESYTDAIAQRDLKRDELRALRSTTQNPSGPIAPLFETYMKQMENIRHLRPGALKAKREGVQHLLKAAGVLGDLNRDKLKELRDDMLDGHLSSTSVGIRLREVKAFVRWLHFEGHLTVNPWVGIELPTSEPKPRFLTNEELVTLERVCTGRLRALVRMAYLTGMRLNEILTARWEDISWIKGRAFITVWAVTAKNRRSRTIPLRQEVVRLLGSRGSGRLFEDWNKHSLRWAWECAKEKAEFVGRVRFHDLRHTFCRLYLEGGATIADLMTITGHQSIVMMRVYSHFEVKYRADRMDAINLPNELDPTGQIQGSSTNLEVTNGDSDTPEVTTETPPDDDNSASAGAIL